MEKTTVSGNTTYPALVGNIIARLRREQGIGQAEFAALVGLGQSTWSRIEKGQSALTIEQLARAAEQLGLQPHELLAVVDGARSNLEAQGIGTLLDRIGAGNMALLGSIPVVGPSLTAVLSGISTYREYANFQKEMRETPDGDAGPAAAGDKKNRKPAGKKPAAKGAPAPESSGRGGGRKKQAAKPAPSRSEPPGSGGKP